MHEKDDFGFTFESTEDTIQHSKAQLLYDKILPFLEHLKGEKDRDIIKWPGEQREQQINKFIQQLNDIMKENE